MGNEYTKILDSVHNFSPMTLEEMEQAMIEKSMIQYNNNVGKVAEVLGISRAAVYRRLEKFGIKP